MSKIITDPPVVDQIQYSAVMKFVVEVNIPPITYI